MNTNRLSRRSFLGAASAAVMAPTIVPSSIFGANAPSKRIGVGVIGLGAQGSRHVDRALRIPGMQLLAVCDVYASKAEKLKQHADQYYAKHKAKGTYKGCTSYQDFRKLLARDDIDAVFIASPENWHGVHMIMSAKAGKDIYGEKSLTHSIREGRALVHTVRRYGTVFQAGTQQRSDAKFRMACELARNGYLGKISEVRVSVPGGNGGPKPGVWPVVPVPKDLDYNMWLGPAQWKPHRRDLCTWGWYFVSDYCPGWITSWGAHHMDIAMWGLPELHEGQMQIDGTAKFFKGTADVAYEWDANIVTKSGLRLNFVDNSKSHGQGCRFIGDKGWIHVNRRGIKASNPALLKIKMKPGDTHLQVSKNHAVDFLNHIHDRRDPVAPVEACHRATTLSRVSDIAIRVGRKVTWDWDKSRFVNDKIANRMLSRVMRAPWRV